MKTREQIVEECNALIPRDVIQTREGGKGMKLSYLPGFHVINHLNSVLGQGNWAYSSDATLVHQESLKRQGRDGKEYTVESVHYTARVRLVVTIGGVQTEFTDYGYGDGTDTQSRGKAHELAIKEAVTDGLKRAARNLGNSFGNGLYDKSGEGIETDTPQDRTQSPPSNTPPGVSSDATIRLISATGKVAMDKKRLTEAQLVGMVKEYGVVRKEDLSPTQAQELLSKLKEIVNV